MKIIKRNGSEMPFDSSKIYSAISRANAQVADVDRISPEEIQTITDQVTEYCVQLDRAPGVEEVQDRVEHELMAHGCFCACQVLYYHTAIHAHWCVRVIPPMIRSSASSNAPMKRRNRKMPTKIL